MLKPEEDKNRSEYLKTRFVNYTSSILIWHINPGHNFIPFDVKSAHPNIQSCRVSLSARMAGSLSLYKGPASYYTVTN